MLTNIILILIFLGFIAGGWKDGFIATFGRLIGAFAGFILAQNFAHFLEPILGIFLSDGWSKLLAFLIIFLIVTRVVGFLFGLIGTITRIFAHIPGINLINNSMGAIIGIFEGILIMGGTLWLLFSSQIFLSILPYLERSAVSDWIQIAFHQVLTRLPLL